MPISTEYLAAFFDAEGNCSLHFVTLKRRKEGCNYCLPRVGVTNKVKEILEEYHSRYGGGIRKGSGKFVWRWQSHSNKETRIFLEEMLPYLQIKKPHATLLLEYISRHEGYAKRNPMNERDFKILKELKELNKRGVQKCLFQQDVEV